MPSLASRDDAPSAEVVPDPDIHRLELLPNRICLLVIFDILGSSSLLDQDRDGLSVHVVWTDAVQHVLSTRATLGLEARDLHGFGPA